MICPVCGISYKKFRTSLTYKDIYSLFWVYSDNASTWHNKRRRTILGRWHAIKLRMWQEHIDCCSYYEDVVDIPF
jgi:hypothetical protein